MHDAPVNAELLRLSGMPASEFLLQREPMLLLDDLVETQGDYTICERKVVEGTAFVLPGKGVPTYVGVEFMAQCIGVHAGARARIDGYAPPFGLLLGTRRYEAFVPWIGAGSVCRIECRELIRDAYGMGSYDCSIRVEEELIAQARLAVLEKERGRSIFG